MPKKKEQTSLELSKENAPASVPAAAVRAQLHNDWSGVNDQDKVKYAVAMCKALDIPTPMNPFKFIPMRGGKHVFYAPSEAAQLIAKRNNISVQILNKYLDRDQNIYVVEVRAVMKDGRVIDNISALSMAGKTGEDRANAMMKAVTKAHRRAVFSAVGLSAFTDDDVEAQGGAKTYDNAMPLPIREVASAVLGKNGDAPTVEEAQQIDDTLEARSMLLDRLCEVFAAEKEKNPAKKAKEWIEQNMDKPLEMLSEDECMEANAMLCDELGHYDGDEE